MYHTLVERKEQNATGPVPRSLKVMELTCAFGIRCWSIRCLYSRIEMIYQQVIEIISAAAIISLSVSTIYRCSFDHITAAVGIGSWYFWWEISIEFVELPINLWNRWAYGGLCDRIHFITRRSRFSECWCIGVFINAPSMPSFYHSLSVDCKSVIISWNAGGKFNEEGAEIYFPFFN